LRRTGQASIDPVDRFLRLSCPQGDRRLHAGGPGAQLAVLGDHAVGPGGTSLRSSRTGVSQVEAGAGEERAELPGNQVQVTSLPRPLRSAEQQVGAVPDS
jgi:hypothetical protein